MSDAARTATPAASAATSELVRLWPAGSSLSAGAYASTQAELVTRWHTHDMHQLAYAADGAVQVETAAARYLLPPQQAVWIPAGLAHRTTLRQVRDISLFFEPTMIQGYDDRARVLAVEPVLREMVCYATRWPVGRAHADPSGDAYFRALAILIGEWLEQESPFFLPTSADPCVAQAMRHTEAHLSTVTMLELSRVVALSERSLRRRFVVETGLTWREYLLRSRLLRAMSLLSESDSPVAAVAARVGFSSASAFARSFARYTGQSPSAYRGRH